MIAEFKVDEVEVVDPDIALFEIDFDDKPSRGRGRGKGRPSNGNSTKPRKPRKSNKFISSDISASTDSDY